MFRNVFKQSYTWFIIIGLIGYAFGLTYTGVSIIAKESIDYGSYTWTYWRIDTFEYVKSLETSLDINNLSNIDIIPPTLPQAPNWSDILKVLKYFVSVGFIYVFNWIIFVLDFILLKPLQLLLYPINIFYALLGLDTANTGWIQIFKNLYSANIPYIPYI